MNNLKNKPNQAPKSIIYKLKKIVVNYLTKLNYLGLMLAVVFFALSMSPSLLPRTALIQGIVSGLSIIIGYGFGVAISHLIRWGTESDVPKRFKRPAWLFLYIGGAITIIIFAWLGKLWHDEVRSLVGLPPDHGIRIFTVIFIALVVAMLLLAVSRAVRRLFRFLMLQIDRALPRRISTAISFVIVTLLIFWILSGVFASNFLAFANHHFGARDNTVPDGYSQPIDPLRSGSPESLSEWDKIGYQGRKFVAGGPSKNDIANVMGGQAKDPIRVYVGLKQAETAEQRAEIAVKELERTGAFKRSVLILATTTGSGWLEPSAVDSIEYIYGGNSAIVSQQYSYLPSWISYLSDKQTATDAGQALFDAVYGKWSQMPKESRPKLYAYGLSLGSFGGQTPYSGVNDLRFSIDGALFVGTPNFTQLWRNITDNRDKGTPEWQPIYKEARAVRFANDNQSIISNQDNWQYPRLLYVQHASDPVVWFDFSLIDTKPDWLNETRGPDVSPATRWFPAVTFLQLGIDQVSAGNVPVGHGHMYGNAVVNSWVSVTNPPNWTADKTTKLQNFINENY